MGKKIDPITGETVDDGMDEVSEVAEASQIPNASPDLKAMLNQRLMEQIKAKYEPTEKFVEKEGDHPGFIRKLFGAKEVPDTMGTRSKYQAELAKAQEEAEPDLGQRLTQALATFAMINAGKGAPDFSSANNAQRQRALDKVKGKYELGDLLKLSQATKATGKQEDAHYKPILITEIRKLDPSLQTKDLIDLSESALRNLYVTKSQQTTQKAATEERKQVRQDRQDELDLKREEREEQKRIKEEEKKLPKHAFDKLEPDKKLVLEGVAKKTADITIVRNQIDAALKELSNPKATEQMKIQVGRQLLKTLNSPMGADAVGAEEAKRLGGYLEYTIDPATKGLNPFNWGPNLEKFKEQATMTKNQLDSAIKENESLKDKYFQEAGIERPVSKTMPSGFPRQVRLGNKVATVSNQQELDEALSEGWK